MEIKNDMFLLSADALVKIKAQAEQLEEAGLPAWAQTVRLLIFNVESASVALDAALKLSEF